MKETKKKSKIIEQSKELFEKFGYQKTTLTNIAESIGYVKSAIYYYFSGKEEIFAALVKKEAEDFLEKLIKIVAKSELPSEQLRLYIDTRITLMENVSKRYQFLKSEFFELMPLIDANRKESDDKEILFVTNILDRAIKEEGLSIDNSSFTAKLLMQNIKGLEIQMFVTDQMQAHNENREAFIDFILFGVFNKKN
ncbi:MAG: AcrR family transcriptional regulator [Crocinitomicaceae bacterium]|jgi:AcrR family transcriptional regulator